MMQSSPLLRLQKDLCENFNRLDHSIDSQADSDETADLDSHPMSDVAVGCVYQPWTDIPCC